MGNICACNTPSNKIDAPDKPNEKERLITTTPTTYPLSDDHPMRDNNPLVCTDAKEDDVEEDGVEEDAEVKETVEELLEETPLSPEAPEALDQDTLESTVEDRKEDVSIN